MASPTPWCLPNDISVRCTAAGVSGVDLANMCQAATDVLFKLSGEQFDQRTDTFRPHKLNPMCGCGGAGWGSGYGGRVAGWGCDCEAPDEIVLPGPVQQLINITIDGVVVTGAALAMQFALFDDRRLVRLNTATGFVSFPCCQRLSAPLTEAGTWAITFTHGKPPPEAAGLAAEELAFQLALLFDLAGPNAACRLPKRVSNIVRQGVSVTLLDAFDFLEDGKTGLYFVDLFLASFNRYKISRRARVYSPDVPGLARS